MSVCLRVRPRCPLPIQVAARYCPRTGTSADADVAAARCTERPMRIPRIYVPEPLRPGREVELPVQAGEHLARVLRLDRGHPLRLCDGSGDEYEAELASLAKRSVTARVLESAEAEDRESPLRITLAQGIARGEKMDWILQKATELGVARIVPVVTDRTEVKLDAERAERRVAH